MIRFAVKNSIEQYKKEFRYLKKEHISDLHGLFLEAFSEITSLQHHERINELIKKANSKNGQEFFDAINDLKTEINKESHYSIEEFPALAVFEYLAGMRLRKDQPSYVPQGEKYFVDLIIQRLMAAGKTFVLGTILALMKADGYHLSVLIPPSSLFQTNAQDMHQRSVRFFDQKANAV